MRHTMIFKHRHGHRYLGYDSTVLEILVSDTITVMAVLIFSLEH